MQKLAELSVRRPVFATVIIATLTVVGAFALFRLGVDRFPKVDFPTIIVATALPGAAPDQVETEVSDKIEEAVNTIAGIDELRSISSEGLSQVIVSFVLEKDADVAAQEVRDKVNTVLRDLPDGIEQPIVQKFDPDASPILTLAVTSDRSVRDITEFADKTLRRSLENVSGVGQVLVFGGRERQVNVWLDAMRLRAYNITVTDVQRALQAQNAEIPGGRVEQGQQTLTLRTLGKVQSVEGFGQIVVKERDGHVVRLGDVAVVEDGMAQAESLANLDGMPTVALAIRKQSGTNTVAVVDAVKQRLADIEPTLPPGYDIRVVRDQSTFIRASIHAVNEHLVLGAIFAAIVVFFFLWNLRSTIISAVAIPTSIVATFALMYYMDFTLNSMTMLALTLAVGIVIDDAIVVLENIYRFIEEKGRPPFQAAIEATREIGLAVMATTFSLVAIFIPVAFMGGIVGRFMKSFGLTMAFAILVSLLVSFTLTPMMSARWLKRPEPGSEGSHSKESRFFSWLDRRYTRVLQWALAHRAWVAAGTVAIFLSTIPLFIVVNKTFLPEDDKSEFEINVRAPEGTSLQQTELIMNRIAGRVRETQPETLYTVVIAASDQAQTPNVGTVFVKLQPIEARSRSQFEVMARVREDVLPTFADLGLRTAVQPVPDFGGGGAQSAEVQFLVTGPDLKTLEDAGQKVLARAREIPGLVDVDTSTNFGKPEVAVTIDRLKAADLGVSPADAANALRLLVGGDEVTTYNEGGEQYDVHLRARADDRNEAGTIGLMTVPSSRLGTVALENIASFEGTKAPAEINRLNRQRQVTVYANVRMGESQTTAMGSLQQAFDDLKLPAAYQARFSGRSRELGRAAQNFVLAFLLSGIFMYLILAAQFESWLHPVTILLSLPLTIPFALLSIMITGQSVNIFSSLGLLVLFGVVKKNSILQIDHAIQLEATGMDKDAAVVQASRDRLRPILMTTIAFVAGMLPLVISGGEGAGTNRAIGFVIIGGQSLVLALTLVVTPVAFSLFDDATRKRAAWMAALRERVGRRRVAAATGAVLLAVLAGGAAHASAAPQAAPEPQAAQTGTPAVAPQAPATAPAAPPVPAPTGPDLRLTLEEAVARALEHNPDLAIVRIEPDLGAARTAQARSAYMPVIGSSLARSSTSTPSTSSLFGEAGLESDDWFGGVGVRQRLPWGGGTYNVSWNAARVESTNPLVSFNPTLSAGIQVAFSQPLLRDLLMDPATFQLTITKRNQQISDLAFRQAVVQTVATVKRAYWDLVAANAAVLVQTRSLELARELARINKARVDVGQSPPLDLVAAEAEVAARRQALVRATLLARNLEDVLRTLIMAPEDTAMWQAHVVPADTVPPPATTSPDVDTAVAAAVESRLDLQRARLELENAGTAVKYYAAQRLPDVRLEASYGGTGLGGTKLIRTGGFPGTVSGTEEIPFSDVLGQTFGYDYPSWSVGVTVNYTLGTSYEKASHAKAQLEERQARLAVDSLALRTVTEIRAAGREIQSAAERVEAARAALDLAEQRLDAEQKRYEVGLSTSFLVTQAQRDLAQAGVDHLQAQLDYQKAVVDFDALRVAPSGGLGLAGANVVAIPPPAPGGLFRQAAGLF
ncbi:MAG: efflux RND transporter permease subunit [Vicinamibacteraceae bacterium]|nr:efflux RND transporter permease subunit [Vicinamibacteraceae bacterium]